MLIKIDSYFFIHHLKYILKGVIIMSIGKRLLLLRQQKGLSQEKLAQHLHISRQTISKWESDLSLPDMKMMIEISNFYHISLNELLGLEENSSQEDITQLYEQTNLVLENIQKENKKRRFFDYIIIGIGLISLIISMVLLIQVRHQKQPIINQYVDKTDTVDRIDTYDTKEDTCYFEIKKYHFDNMMIDVSIQMEPVSVKDNSKATLVLKDINDKEYTYDMKLEKSLLFTYDNQIPLTNYKEMVVIVANEGNKTRCSINEGDTYLLNNIIENYISLVVPVIDGNVSNNQVYFSTKETIDNIEYDGRLTGTCEITLNDGDDVILNQTIDISQDQYLKLDKKLHHLDDIYGSYTLTSYDNKYDGYINTKYLNSTIVTIELI